MFTVNSPESLLRWMSKHLEVSNDKMITVGGHPTVHGSFNVSSIIVSDNEDTFDVAMHSLCYLEGFVSIVGINAGLDKGSHIDKVESNLKNLSLDAGCLDILRVDWVDKTFTSDMCENLECCDRTNPKPFFHTEETLLDYDDLDNIEEDDDSLELDLPQELKEFLDKLMSQ